MKILGMVFLSICPILFGLSKAKKKKKRQKTIEKLIELLNYIIAEIRYKKTDILTLIMNLSLKESFKKLEFLQNLKNKIKLKPFPIAWASSINESNLSIDKDDENLLKSVSNILGAYDSKDQIVALKHINSQFKESLKNAKENYLSKGKIAKSLGILIAIAIVIILI